MLQVEIESFNNTSSDYRLVQIKKNTAQQL